MATKKSNKGALPAIAACYDHERRTCIQVLRADGDVYFIPLDVTEGLQVVIEAEKEFDHRFKPMVDYPVERAAQLYVTYAQTIGATKEALDYLSKVTTITKQEYEMATTKKAATTASKTTSKSAAKKTVNGRTAKAATKTDKAAVKPVTTKKATAAEPAKKTGKVSAAQMFQDLIMKGTMTDDKIFEKVQEAYGLDEKKRGYVKWYRNHLTKQGKNPPAAK